MSAAKVFSCCALISLGTSEAKHAHTNTHRAGQIIVAYSKCFWTVLGKEDSDHMR